MKRTRSQRFSGGLEDSTPDPAAEKSTASDLQMAESSSPERKRVRPTFEGEVNEAHVESIMKALRKKPEWQRKVADPDIARRYALEAAQQGASGASIAVALRRLLAEAVAGGKDDEDSGPNFACTLSVPSMRVDEKHGWPVDDEDDDYRVDEDMENLWNDRKIKGPDGHTYRIRERTDINRVRYVDGAVPDDLRTRLEAQLDAIANVPDKDFHPGSDGKVQDLIHPSLYPYVRGVSFERSAPGGPSADVTAVVTSKAPQSSTKSRVRDDDEEEDEKDDEKKSDDEDDAEDSLDQWEDLGLDPDTERDYRNEERELDAFTTKSIYQWLPAEFDVAPDGEVSIATYINNLDRARHPELYDTIAQVFRLFLPLFAAVLPGGEQRVYGRRLQVVVKAANYVLQPGQNYDGSWHVEGMPQECIAASGIYYYSTSPHLSADTCLAFRTKRFNSMGERGDAGQGWNFNVNLGSVPTPAGRCLVFANDLQHRVKGMRNDGQEPGVRKILCFFVVDPAERVKSSLDIPPQQWQVQRRLVARALAEAACKVLGGPGRGLPRELVVMITEAAKWGFTKEEAEKHRETLMHERKYYIDANNRLWERPFSFCEH